MPRNFRQILKNATGASRSLIDKILREERPDNYGVILEAYKIANEQMKKQINNASELERLKKELNEHAA